jgi:predicted RNA-binding Zn ribbon-like protein
MTASRRGPQDRAKVEALGDAIIQQLGGLQAFADYLNYEPTPTPPDPGWSAEWVAHHSGVHQELHWTWETAREIATRSAGRAALPETVLSPLRALAERTPVTHLFAIKRGQRRRQGARGQWVDESQWVITSQDPTRARLRLPATRPDVALELESPSASLAGFVHVLAYVQSPHRERLKCCQRCATWFVDTTRNKSARRCSRACTIAWSNKQRPKGGAR